MAANPGALRLRPDLAAHFAISRRLTLAPWDARRTPPPGGVLMELEELRRR
jgi:hypothetical protein